MSKKWICLDFETASGCDLKKAGAYVYAENPTTEITALCYVTHYGYGYELDPAKLSPEDNPGLLAEVNDPEVMFVAHNAAFERAIWREIMVKRFNWPDIPIERWHCTMAVALMKGLPAKLDVLSTVLGFGGKDMEGNKVALGLSKFNKKTGMLDHSPALIRRTSAYCMDDVEKEVKVLRRTHNFYGGERKVWEMDQRINDRGIRIDDKYVHACMGVVQRALPPLLTRFSELTGGLKPTQGEKLKGWLSANGLEIDSLNKETVSRLMGEELEDGPDSDQITQPITMPPVCREALYIRGLAASASVKKLPAMLACQGSDGRARGLMQYHGAGPGRWAGRILQPHNFPRAGLDVGDNQTASPDELMAAIMEGDDSYLRMVFGEPIEAVSAGLRHALVSDEDKTFLIADFKTIEARVVLAVAGQHDALKSFTEGDPYSAMAEKIFHTPVNKKDQPELRQTGKNTILGCGFQMGAPKFQMRYCPKETIEFAQSCIDAYRKDLAPKVVELWYGLERAATEAVWSGEPQEYNGIVYIPEGEWLTCLLPSGRKLWYYGPQKTMKPMPWDINDVRPGWSHLTYKAGRLIRRDAYGGLLTENVVQGMARDLLVHCVFLCEHEQIPTVLTVHDENVCESHTERAKLFRELMTNTPDWAKQYKIPVEIDFMQADRYRK